MPLPQVHHLALIVCRSAVLRYVEAARRWPSATCFPRLHGEVWFPPHRTLYHQFCR